MRAFLLSSILFFLFSGSLVGQRSNESSVPVKIPIAGDTLQPLTPKKNYDPKIASRRSALLPGLGQIYNDSWWKVPILYAGLGVTIHFIYFNDEQYRYFRGIAKPLIEIEDDPTQSLTATQSNQLRVARRQADYWRENRDLLLLTTLGIYALNIIEASIDAHLKGFNVDDNLALNLKPKLGVISNGVPYFGFSATFRIGQ